MLYFDTNGKGYWSNKATEVTVERMELSYCNDERDFGELRVYFDTSDWDVNTDGLIYTDKEFMRQLTAYCLQEFNTTDVEYSEQGMQGDNYVSCDVGADFIAKFPAVALEF